jgi:hypothetical protein
MGIQVQEGNFLTDDLGRDYDIALLFNISHGLTPEEIITLLQKVAKALNPGGFAVILEQFDTNLPLPMSRAVNNILGLSYFHLLGGPTNRLKAGSEQLASEISSASTCEKCWGTVW